MNRREILAKGFVAAGACLTAGWSAGTGRGEVGATETLEVRIRTSSLELAPGVHVPVLTSNGSFKGFWLETHAHERFDIDLTNESDRAISLKAPCIDQAVCLAAAERRVIHLRGNPSSFECARVATMEPSLQLLSGIAGTIVRPHPACDADQVHHLSIHHWLPSPAAGVGPLLSTGLSYRYTTFDDRLLGASEPIRVREGQRVRFEFFNAGLRRSIALALPRHRFVVLELDGYGVFRPRAVRHLVLGPGERVAALVRMDSPGRYVLGSIDRRDRAAGFGRVIEYTKARGAALHPQIESPIWDYHVFGSQPTVASDPSRIPLLFKLAEGTATDSHCLTLREHSRYRLSLINATGERPSIALRGHNFRLRQVAGAEVAGLLKDTIALPAFARTDIDFVATARELHLEHGDNVQIVV